jgi:membrane protein insertase Oxa1/YidC/SpoIIIJ
MHYIDLLLSFVLFVVAILTLSLKRFKKNVVLVSVCLLFFPIAIVMYYFPETDRTIFQNVSLLQIVVYPLIKLLFLFIILHYIFETRKKEGK